RILAPVIDTSCIWRTVGETVDALQWNAFLERVSLRLWRASADVLVIDGLALTINSAGSFANVLALSFLAQRRAWTLNVAEALARLLATSGLITNGSRGTRA